MKVKIIILVLVSLASGCSDEGFEYSSMRFGIEQGLKSSCDSAPKCLKKFEEGLERCLSKEDINVLVNTSTSELDAKAIEVSLKTLQCING